MGNIWAIFKREFRGYWNTPVAYVVMTLFLLITGFFFRMIFSHFVQFSDRYAQFKYQYPNLEIPNVSQSIFQFFFGAVVVLEFIFLLPLLTMRLIAEERRSGTMELLFTYPIREREIVMGKYLSAIGFLAIMILCTFAYPLMLHWMNPGCLNLRVLFCGYLGFFLIGAVFIAIGTFASSVTKDQIVAANITTGVLLLLYVVFFIRDDPQVPKPLGAFFGYLSFFSHYENFTKGIINTSDVVYCLVMIAFSLFMTQRMVEVHRWKG